jgi:hypothetical protein
MSYAVDWEPTAEQELTDIWMNADNPNAVTHAANEAERRLKYQPLGVGESRGGSVRVLFEPPLVVYYEVDAAAKRVSVRNVRAM